MRFRYSALTTDGQTVSGIIEMPNRASAVDLLQHQGLLPIEAVDAASIDIAESRARLRGSRALAGVDQILLSRQLSNLVTAGLPVDRALQITAGLMRSAKSRLVVEDILRRVRDGDGLSDAMGAHEGALSSVIVAMVRAGEQGGVMPEVLGRAADYVERSQAVRQNIISALIYPAILGIVALLAITIVLTVVLPEFEPIFQEAGTRLPAITRFVMAIGRWARIFWWSFPLTAWVSVMVLSRVMRAPRYRLVIARQILRLPVVGVLNRRSEGARFARTLSALLENGVPAERALGLAAGVVQNPAISSALCSATEHLRQGEGLSRPLEKTGLLPDLLPRLARLGEETGRLSTLLGEAASILEAEAQRDVDRLLALLVPAVTIFMGGVIALIIAAVLLAMLSINDIAG